MSRVNLTPAGLCDVAFLASNAWLGLGTRQFAKLARMHARVGSSTRWGGIDGMEWAQIRTTRVCYPPTAKTKKTHYVGTKSPTQMGPSNGKTLGNDWNGIIRDPYSSGKINK
eukprot:gnl/TRDRNA2_/TRDRNA2_89482_c1_seq1.p1 gnl/TRDRNA2_/TRDRNA2_89482_c1~~gnl/TRDRNA2_/TRDRNA2_89482_c1_seq1.p1  ORF type:complete len:112 (-),score=0.15 gnl/TRDRNA2_/TRDRNA2_89482_c1_seq1:50-385(-)